MTVLSPRGIPTPLAATRLLPPDSLMAAAPRCRSADADRLGSLQAKYGQTVDRQSAYEMITARLVAAKQATAEARPSGDGAGVPPTTATGLNTMTAAEQEREIRRQAREMAAAERGGGEGPRGRADARPAADARARDRMVETGVRTAGRVVTSRAGQDLLRGVFGTLFGKH